MNGLPRVTDVLRAVFGPGFQAGDWYMQRGKAVHACCALLAKGIAFKNDERISGQVEACIKFLDAYRPDGMTEQDWILYVEKREEHKVFRYSGQPDLIVQDALRRKTVVDYKASLGNIEYLKLQLGGYAELFNCNWGMGVELHEDGTFKATELLDLRIPRRDFLSVLRVYRLMELMGRLPKGGEDEQRFGSDGTDTGDKGPDSQV